MLNTHINPATQQHSIGGRRPRPSATYALAAACPPEVGQEFGRRLAWAIEAVIEGYPNIGKSGWWTHPSQHLKQLQDERTAMRTVDFLDETVVAGFYMMVQATSQPALQWEGHSVAELAAGATDSAGFEISAGAILCAAHGMGICIEVPAAEARQGGNISDVRVLLSQAWDAQMRHGLTKVAPSAKEVA